MITYPTPPNAAAVYRILAEECDAPVREHDDYGDEDLGFARHWNSTDQRNPREWRFQGNQGFGGKVHWDGRKVYVTCYPEHDNPERSASRAKANGRLAQMVSDPDGYEAGCWCGDPDCLSLDHVLRGRELEVEAKLDGLREKRGSANSITNHGEVLATLRDAGMTTVSTLAKAMAISSSTARRYLGDLEGADLAMHQGVWWSAR